MTESRSERLHVEPSRKRVRAAFGGEFVADTIRPVLVWESPHYPSYYVPVDDVRGDLLSASETTSHSPSRGDAVHFTVKAGGREAVDAAWRYPESPIEALRDLVRFDLSAMDHWFEEDEEVFTHARDPH